MMMMMMMTMYLWATTLMLLLLVVFVPSCSSSSSSSTTTTTKLTTKHDDYYHNNNINKKNVLLPFQKTNMFEDIITMKMDSSSSSNFFDEETKEEEEKHEERDKNFKMKKINNNKKKKNEAGFLKDVVEFTATSSRIQNSNNDKGNSDKNNISNNPTHDTFSSSSSNNNNKRDLQSCPLFYSSSPIRLDAKMIQITGSTIGLSSTLPNNSNNEEEEGEDGDGGGCIINNNSPTAWYRFTTDVDSPIAITTCSNGTTFDTVITVFEDGENCQPKCIASNDDNVINIHSRPLKICFEEEEDPEVASLRSYTVIFNEGVRKTYYVAVSGNDETAVGIFDLTIITFDDDPTDNICPYQNAIPIDLDFDNDDNIDNNGNSNNNPSSGVVMVAGTTIDGPANLPYFQDCSINLGVPTAWYKITTSRELSLSISTCSLSTNYDTYIHVFQGGSSDEDDPCSNNATTTTTCLGGNDDHDGIDQMCASVGNSVLSNIRLETTPDATYYIVVSGYVEPAYGFSQGEFELQITEITPSSPTLAPTPSPPTPSSPTLAPTPSPPTLAPTPSPTPTLAPTPSPPTLAPTLAPSLAPTLAPTPSPTPTSPPTLAPTPSPTPTSEEVECFLASNTQRRSVDVAIPIMYEAGGIVNVAGDTTGASPSLPDSLEGDINDCSVDNGSPVVWYTFTPTVAETLLITTCSESTLFDTKLVLFVADDPVQPCNPICLTNNDDHDGVALCRSNLLHSAILTETQPGEIYYIAVTGFSPETFGEFELALVSLDDDDSGGSDGECPFIGSTNITIQEDTQMTIPGTTDQATPSLPDDIICSQNTGSPTMWYRLQVTSRIRITIHTCSLNTEFDTVLTLFKSVSENDCSYECVAGNDDHGTNDIYDGLEVGACTESIHSLIVRPINPGIYYLAVSGYDASNVGGFEISILAESFPCPLTAAIPIEYDPAGTFVFGDTTGAPSNLPEAERCSFNLGSPTVWYKIQTNKTADLIAHSCSENTLYDTIMNIFEVESEEDCTLECLAGGDDHGTNFDICSFSEYHTVVGVRNAPPGIYYIAISGYADAEQNCAGEYELTISLVDDGEDGFLPTLPPGSDCPLHAATWIDFALTESTFVFGNNEGAPANLPESGDCSTNSGGATVWYKFQTVEEATIAITTCTQITGFDTVIHVFEEISDADCSYNCLANNDDHNSTELTDSGVCFDELFSFIRLENLSAGIYYIAVSGFSVEDEIICTGDFGLQIATVGAPTPAPIFDDSATGTTEAPVRPYDPNYENAKEAELVLAFGPVYGPYPALGDEIVVRGSTTFLSILLFGDADATPSNGFLEVTMLESGIIDLGGPALRVGLRVIATYNGEEHFVNLLKAYIADNEDVYSLRLQLAEAELTEREGSPNSEYFSSLSVIHVLFDGSGDDGPTTTPTMPPTAEGDSGAGDGRRRSMHGLFVAVAIVAMLLIPS